MRFLKRKHCGGLAESLMTICEISKEDFISLLEYYDFYGFDPRCNQLLWIDKNLGNKGFSEYTWLCIEL